MGFEAPGAKGFKSCDVNEAMQIMQAAGLRKDNRPSKVQIHQRVVHFHKTDLCMDGRKPFNWIQGDRRTSLNRE